MILGSAVLFPGTLLPLRIFEPRYRRMLEEALGTHRMFCLAMRKPGCKRETPMPVAGLGMVRAAVRMGDGTFNLVLQGVSRVLLEPARRYRPYRVHPLVPLDGEAETSPEVEALRQRVLGVAAQRLKRASPSMMGMMRLLAREGTGEALAEGCLTALQGIAQPGHLADLVTLLLVEDPLFRQLILQAHETKDRLEKLLHILGMPDRRPGKSEA